ncbi:MAG TPA: hypothetical protein VGR41_10030 [Actinomycetota bacterium]|jgi:type II secretory pathway pseudopilin PulG|nr:hypothetical protein [Actinomycetota bacterium]
MTQATLLRRLRARAADERGFTIVESMIAITIIFASLVALAYTATAGFRYIAYSRDRIKATAQANKIMEQIRGLSYASITRGLSNSDLTGDSLIVSCSGFNRFESCAGEKIVSSTGLPTTAFLVPHTGTIDADTVTLSWATYVTNDDPTVNPYRLTVVVTWVGGAIPNSASNTVRLQSLFWSPNGCVSSVTHPFGAPCQPYFYGQSLVPQPLVAISGLIHDLTFQSATLKGTGVESNIQQEQVTEIQGTITETGVEILDNGITTTDGGATTNVSAADSDPALPGNAYQTNAVTGVGGTLSAYNTDSPGQVGMAVTAPSGDLGSTDAAVTSAGANVCPPPTDTAETDSLPCGGSRIQQAGTVTATMPMGHLAGGLGPATLVNWATASTNPNKTFVDRETVAGQDGRIEMTATRRIGTINIGGLPGNLTDPTGWDPAGTPVYEKYCVTLDAYQDVSTSQAGSTTVAPTNTISSGTLWYYNTATSTYSSLSATSTSIDTLAVTCTQSGTVSGKAVTWTVSVTAGALTHATSALNQTTSGSARTDVDTSITPVKGTVRYTVVVDGVTEVDLSIVLDLGTMITRGIYKTAPTSG